MDTKALLIISGLCVGLLGLAYGSIFWGLVGIGLFVGGIKAKSSEQLTPEQFCPNCGAVAKPTKTIKGSFLVELVLWLCFIFPGLIYSVWRHSGEIKSCPKCQGKAMIPTDSPVAQAALQKPES